MDLTAPAPLSLPTLIFNLVLGLVLSIIISWYYVRYGQSLSNRARFAPILPILTLITLLVISIVKSSLALSLGLVGALSIVRFRTAIKDPEELIFLFFAIAIGLGMGADQRVPTLAAVVVIMVYLFVRRLIDSMIKKKPGQSMYLNISMQSKETSSVIFNKVNDILTEELNEIDLRRMDTQKGNIQITYYISVVDQSRLTKVIEHLESEIAGCNISLIEQNNLLGG